MWILFYFPQKGTMERASSGQDMVLDLFRSLIFLRRYLPAYAVFSNLAHVTKERARPSFPGAGVVRSLGPCRVKCLSLVFEGQHVSI